MKRHVMGVLFTAYRIEYLIEPLHILCYAVLIQNCAQKYIAENVVVNILCL
jgi:hypothetical protein